MLNLYDIEKNVVGVVLKIDNNIDSKQRLAEMGLMPGADVRMIKKAPMGGPIQIKINNYYLTLRKEDAVSIYLEVSQS
tara:strand:- start:1142 stop:1375 length:234 start_codon:yes stop_codon:yes gene_type:complete